MKYSVVVILLGFSSCDGNRQTPNYTHEVATQEECFALVEQWLKLPFVLQATCRIDKP